MTWAEKVVEAITEIAADEGYRQACMLAGDDEPAGRGDARERLTKLLEELVGDRR